MLAIIRALEEWRHFLEGAEHQFKIWTDHKNLEYCYNFASTCVECYFFISIYYLHTFTLIVSGTCSYSFLFISDQTCVCLSLFISILTCVYLYFFIHAFALLVTCVDLTFYLPSTWGLIVYKPVDTWLYSLAISLRIYFALFLLRTLALFFR